MTPKEACLAELRKLTKHSNVKLTNCGNTAILIALAMAKRAGFRNVLIPDQGGWLSYLTYPPLLEMNVVKFPTKDALIDPQELAKALSLHLKAMVLFPSFGGYFVEQPLEQIAKVCEAHHALLIEDVSGSIGDETLCNGTCSDIIVGSFGNGKTLNLGFGGFLSTNRKDLLDIDDQVFQLGEIPDDFPEQLLQKLPQVKQRLLWLQEQSKKIKQELSSYSVVHPESRSINVVVKYTTPQEKEEMIQHCENHKYPWKPCPRYIRLEEKAVSIEVKELEEGIDHA
ncbi:DegT/DnrJ/EryC1/StrS family aminotransferase [Candidatus Woesearchaeota archaeon]|nr:DegT/DnrJ/EryC1/StrS family aminotransferase [Candidatus Woesearchaeota archaeon]